MDWRRLPRKDWKRNWRVVYRDGRWVVRVRRDPDPCGWWAYIVDGHHCHAQAAWASSKEEAVEAGMSLYRFMLAGVVSAWRRRR